MDEIRISLDERNHSRNLSWVLHDHSESRSVRRTKAIARRFARNRERILRRFAALNNEELSEQITVHPGLTSNPVTVSPPTVTLTTSSGLPELLPRALEATGLSAGPLLHTVTLVDGPLGSSDTMTFELFRGQAKITAPTGFPGGETVILAALLVRPGDSSLLLYGTRLSGADLPEGRGAEEIRRALESIIRDHVDQWIPARPLWNEPAERGLAELRHEPGGRP